MVDGVLTSCYAFPDHELAHFGMTPVHMFHELMKWIFGDANDSPVFVKIAEHIGQFILPLSLN